MDVRLRGFPLCKCWTVLLVLVVADGQWYIKACVTQTADLSACSYNILRKLLYLRITHRNNLKMHRIAFIISLA